MGAPYIYDISSLRVKEHDRMLVIRDVRVVIDISSRILTFVTSTLVKRSFPRARTRVYICISRVQILSENRISKFIVYAKHFPHKRQFTVTEVTTERLI